MENLVAKAVGTDDGISSPHQGSSTKTGSN